MPEDPWLTRITITCENAALRPLWQNIEDELVTIAARCGWDTLRVTKKLKAIAEGLETIRLTTADMRLPPGKRFK